MDKETGEVYKTLVRENRGHGMTEKQISKVMGWPLERVQTVLERDLESDCFIISREGGENVYKANQVGGME